MMHRMRPHPVIHAPRLIVWDSHAAAISAQLRRLEAALQKFSPKAADDD